EGSDLAELIDQLSPDDESSAGRRREVDPAARPLRPAVALCAVGAREQVTAGYDVRVLARYRRQRRADAELLEGLDRIPGADAAHLQLVAAAVGERCERIHVRILGHAISQHDETLPARHAADVELEVLFFVEDGRPVQS